MALNCRFATGVQVLVLLAGEPDTLLTSTDLAEKLDTNPVVIRRVLASLQHAYLITSQKGPAGGSRLLRSPKDISLAAVYRAVETGTLLHIPKVRTAGPARVNAALEKIFASSMGALVGHLGEIKLSQLIKRVGKAAKR